MFSRIKQFLYYAEDTTIITFIKEILNETKQLSRFKKYKGILGTMIDMCTNTKCHRKFKCLILSEHFL